MLFVLRFEPVVGPCGHVMMHSYRTHYLHRDVANPRVWICIGGCCRCENGSWWDHLNYDIFCASDPRTLRTPDQRP